MEEYLFKLMYDNFNAWHPAKESFRLAYRNPAGFPNRCFAYLWHRANEEFGWIQIEANKKAQETILHDLTKLPSGHQSSIWGNVPTQKASAQKAKPTPPAPGAAGKANKDGNKAPTDKIRRILLH